MWQVRSLLRTRVSVILIFIIYYMKRLSHVRVYCVRYCGCGKGSRSMDQLLAPMAISCAEILSAHACRSEAKSTTSTSIETQFSSRSGSND